MQSSRTPTASDDARTDRTDRRIPPAVPDLHLQRRSLCSLVASDSEQLAAWLQAMGWRSFSGHVLAPAEVRE